MGHCDDDTEQGVLTPPPQQLQLGGSARTGLWHQHREKANLPTCFAGSLVLVPLLLPFIISSNIPCRLGQENPALPGMPGAGAAVTEPV